MNRLLCLSLLAVCGCAWGQEKTPVACTIPEGNYVSVYCSIDGFTYVRMSPGGAPPREHVFYQQGTGDGAATTDPAPAVEPTDSVQAWNNGLTTYEKFADLEMQVDALQELRLDMQREIDSLNLRINALEHPVIWNALPCQLVTCGGLLDTRIYLP